MCIRDSNITIQGLELQNVPVNAFYNSNAGTQTSNVTIKNNYVLGTYGHGIKTDDHPSDGAIAVSYTHLRKKVVHHIAFRNNRYHFWHQAYLIP